MYLAEHLARAGHSVRLAEKENSFMAHAAYINQARVHNGYHYPRSVLTALRSRISFPRFVKEFRDCVFSDFEMYYMIGRPLGKVSANQFARFCERIGAPCEQAPARIKALTNPNLIEDCFSVVEYAFDSVKLRDIMLARLAATKARLSLGTTVEAVRQKEGGGLLASLRTSGGETETVYADHVFNCTYSGINRVMAQSGLELVPLKHEMTEMCLVDVPEPLRKIGITVMCGPFFSTMPFPPKGLHSFSHVRYTPHYEWRDGEPGSAAPLVSPGRFCSAWRYMQKDAIRYMPILAECEYRESLWEVKTTLPRSEADDSRPILFLTDYQLKGFHTVLGGKIDNVYDALAALAALNICK